MSTGGVQRVDHIVHPTQHLSQHCGLGSGPVRVRVGMGVEEPADDTHPTILAHLTHTCKAGSGIRVIRQVPPILAHLTHTCKAGSSDMRVNEARREDQAQSEEPGLVRVRVRLR